MNNKLFKAFFGVEPKSVRGTVVISPIIYPKQFEAEFGEKGNHYKSVLSYLVANFKNLTFIKTPMTQSAVHDLIVLLKGSKCKNIIFIGAIGGIAKGLKIGDVVLPDKAKEICSLKSIHDETRTNMVVLRKKGVIGIDFEAQSFYKAARKVNIFAGSAFIVTDLPLTKPFYQTKTQKEREKIKKAVKFIVHSI